MWKAFVRLYLKINLRIYMNVLTEITDDLDLL